jgi:shikimate dehydrogenase
MKRFGLIGHPINHSKSPIIHQIISKNMHREIQYDLLDLDNVSMLKDAIDDLKVGKYDGYNITIPYKEAVLPFLDFITPKALKIGAVNTVYYRDQKVIGDNTDYDGFKYMFLQHLSIHKPNGIIILGSGGAAKSSYAVCKDLGFNPWIVSRNPKPNEKFDKIISVDELSNITYDLIINATPIGMHPNIDASPLDRNRVKDKFVLELIYNPRATKLMEDSRSAIGGLDMLIVQAIHAQNIWFNEDTDIDVKLIDRIKEDLDE